MASELLQLLIMEKIGVFSTQYLIDLEEPIKHVQPLQTDPAVGYNISKSGEGLFDEAEARVGQGYSLHGSIF